MPVTVPAASTPSAPQLVAPTGPAPALRVIAAEHAYDADMAISLNNVGVAVRDLDEAVSFFTDLGLTLSGTDEVSGEWASTAVGLDGNHARIALLTTPEGDGQIELFEYIHPAAIETEPTLPNEIGMHRIAFQVDDIEASLAIAAKHGCFPLRGVANYADVYLLTYLRGPSGIVVMFAQDLRKG